MKTRESSIVRKIESDEKYRRTKIPTTTAPEPLKQKFQDRLDSLFVQCFKKMPQFIEDSFKMDFLFFCNGYGKIIVDLRNIGFQDGISRNWFTDSFNRYIKPWIESETFSTPSDDFDDSALLQDFLAYVKDSIDKTGYDSNEINKTQDSIIGNLTHLMKKSIEVPTKYPYLFKYKSILINAIWKYRIDGNGAPTIKDKSVEPVESFLGNEYETAKQVFLDTIVPEKGKEYNIQICRITINDNQGRIFIRPKQN